jgi:hypothetical protein
VQFPVGPLARLQAVCFMPLVVGLAFLFVSGVVGVAFLTGPVGVLVLTVHDSDPASPRHPPSLSQSQPV